MSRLVRLEDWGGGATWALLAGLVALSFFWGRRRKQQGPKEAPSRPIPGPNVNGFITNIVPLLSIYRNKSVSNSALFLQVICSYCHVFRREGMWLFRGGFRKVLILYKASTVEPVLSSNTILSKGFEYDFITPMLKGGLLTSKRAKWRSRRKLLTPAFHFRILDEFIPVFNEHANILANTLAKEMATKAHLNIAPIMSLCTLDIICETAMGKKINAQLNSESPYVVALHGFCRRATERIMSPWLWWDSVYYWTSSGREFKESLRVMDSFTRQVIVERMESRKDSEISKETGMRGRRPLLDLLLDVHVSDPANFSLDDVAEEVDNFMFAGHDTTSSGLGWALYMLGLHPDIQARVHQELDEVLGDYDESVTLDHIKKLKYLDCVLKETRRLYPPTPFIARELEEDVYIDGCLVPAGTSCGLLIYMLHRDPEVFPNPEAFDPDRFLLSSAAGRHPFAYIPFSAGPRNCIGQRFAIFEGIVVLATLLKKFSVRSLDPLDRLVVVDELVLRSENGLRVAFTPRRETDA